MAAPHLSIVVPAHDEAATIEAGVAAILDWIASAGVEAELIVVDDGSDDRTGSLAARAIGRRPGRVLRVEERRGKGHAVRRGLLAAGGRWALVSDADLSVPIEDYARLAAAMRDDDLDLACGSRRVAGAAVERSPLRAFAASAFNLAVRLTTGLSMADTQCGFKLLDRTRLLPLIGALRVDGFAWDVELLYLCRRFGLRVGEVPVRWHEGQRSNVRLLVDPWPMLFDVLRVRWHDRRGGYDAIAVADAAPPQSKAAGD